MAKILVVGTTTLDLVFDVPHYPVEDAKCRATAFTRVPGGNAANTAYVLAQAGHRVDLLSVLAQDAHGDGLLQALQQRGIGTQTCVRRAGVTPTSVILRSGHTQTRTIVHYRDLEELTWHEVRRLDLSTYDWFHFEGRAPELLTRLVRRARAAVVDAPLSVEFERQRPGLEPQRIPADIRMFSRDWVRQQGTELAPEAFLRLQMQQAPGLLHTLAWGAGGAWMAERGKILHQPATPALPVHDSLAAGDVFNAGLIHAWVSGATAQEALQAAVRLAEHKLVQEGLEGLF